VEPPVPPTGGPLIAAPGGGYQRTSDIGLAENCPRSLGVRFVQFSDSNPTWNNAAVIEEIANNTNEALDVSWCWHPRRAVQDRDQPPVFRGGRQAGHGLGSLHPQPDLDHRGDLQLDAPQPGPPHQPAHWANIVQRVAAQHQTATSRLETHTISCIMRLGTFSGKKTTPTQPVGRQTGDGSTLPAISPTSADERDRPC